jgi:hypothetical protein
MPVLSSVHQLFSAEQCQAYVHMLRWRDVCSTVPGAKAVTSVPGACTTTVQG